jgi:hypothetical protein
MDSEQIRQHSFRPPKFSLAALFFAIALVGVCLAFLGDVSIVLKAYAAFLACVYFSARRMGRKATIACLVITSMFSIIPWCDVGRGVFVYGTRRLPTIPVSDGIREALGSIYEVSTIPLALLTLFDEDFDSVICFAGGTVKPFVVFLFWASVALMFATSLMMFKFERMISSRPKSHPPAAAGDSDQAREANSP